MFAKLIETLKANPRTLVFTEGSDARILEATARLKKDGFLTPILVGVETEVKAAAEKGGFDIEGVRIVDPATYAGMDAMVEKMVELRKGKMTPEDCRKNLMKGNYFGTMLVKMGEADCLLGGATYSTADTVRPALQLIKTKPGNSNVSSCFILQREKDGVDERLCMGDCAIQIDPDEDALVETALECAKTAATFGIDPKIAFLSYSTKGSGKGDAVDKVKNACDKAKAAAPELAIDGEMQFDAAVSPVVGQQKFPGSKVAGHANTFIFPEIQSGNIGYKIAQRLGGFAAYGPILQGLNAPINDQTIQPDKTPDGIPVRGFLRPISFPGTPMGQLGQQLGKVGADLLRGPVAVGQVAGKKFDQLLQIGIGERPVCIAPLAVCLIGGAVGFLADGGLLQRHSAALTDQLPRGPQQCMKGYVKQGGQLLQGLWIWRGFSSFPAGHRLPGYTQFFREFLLGPSVLDA